MKKFDSQKIILLFKKIWNNNFLTFLGILIAVLFYGLDKNSDLIKEREAFRKKIILEICDIHSNCNLLKYSFNQLNPDSFFSNLDYAFLKENLINSQKIIFELKYILKQHIFIDEISEKDLFEISTLVSNIELNQLNTLVILNQNLKPNRNTSLEKIICHQLFLATALRKIYKIKIDTLFINNLKYYSNIMRASSLIGDSVQFNRIVNKSDSIFMFKK